LSDATGSFSSNKTDASLPLIIVNPTSAGGDTARIWTRTASEIHRRFGAFAVEFTRAPGHGKQIALEAAKQGRKLIVACGGDGTINEIANGILESGEPAELGILPSGTGGDFRRTFHLSTDPAQAAADLKNGITETIDAGRVTFTDENGKTVSRYFMGVASFGISTSVIRRVKADKPFAWLPRGLSGRAGFAWSTLQTTLEMKYTKASITLDDGREREVSVVNFCVANARYFGGGMKIAPDARLDDGLFDVVMIGEISTPKILANSYKLYVGKHFDVAEVHHAHARKIVVNPITDEKIRFETDGELPGFLPAVFEIAPRALKIRISKK
jgi:YegS/Rv2252/BmrU family lipid kinase